MQYFRHYKGNYYRVVGEARHSETLEEMVIYQAMYRHGENDEILPAPEGGDLWARPKAMFYERVTLKDGKVVDRFAPVTEDEYLQSLEKAEVQGDTVPTETAAKKVESTLLDALFLKFEEKGYTAEDFVGGCALCGDANEFALDEIDACVCDRFPSLSKFERDRMTSQLYSELHHRFEEKESE